MSYISLTHHARRVHKKRISKYQVQIEGDGSKHQCLVCGKNITFERHYISEHLKCAHKMNINQYEAQFPSELEAIFAAADNSNAAITVNMPEFSPDSVVQPEMPDPIFDADTPGSSNVSMPYPGLEVQPHLLDLFKGSPADSDAPTEVCTLPFDETQQNLNVAVSGIEDDIKIEDIDWQ